MAVKDCGAAFDMPDTCDQAQEGDMAETVTAEMVATFQRDGVVLIKGLWADWVEDLRAGVSRNMAEPGPYASENL